MRTDRQTDMTKLIVIFRSFGKHLKTQYIYIFSLENKGCQENNSSRDEIYEKNSRIHLDRSQNKYTNCKGIKNNINSGQIIGIQEEMDTTCK
jgi:hypothetical protein